MKLNPLSAGIALLVSVLSLVISNLGHSEVGLVEGTGFLVNICFCLTNTPFSWGIFYEKSLKQLSKLWLNLLG